MRPRYSRQLRPDEPTGAAAGQESPPTASDELSDNEGSSETSNSRDEDRRWMRMALDLAERARQAEEIPVGAVVVLNGQAIGFGFNRPISAADPTAHAETLALREAAARIGNYRLVGSTLYATLEPCAMCAGAAVLARVRRLVFGARDLRFGAVRSKFELADSPLLNHRMQVEEGLFAAESAALIQGFLSRRRSPC